MVVVVRLSQKEREVSHFAPGFCVSFIFELSVRLYPGQQRKQTLAIHTYYVHTHTTRLVRVCGKVTIVFRCKREGGGGKRERAGELDRDTST